MDRATGEQAERLIAELGGLPPTNPVRSKYFTAEQAERLIAAARNRGVSRGSYATHAALEAVQWQTTDPTAENYVTSNDYAVVLADESQDGGCWHYVYTVGTGWGAEYRINESPLTQAQLDALNSGATAEIINSVLLRNDADQAATIQQRMTWLRNLGISQVKTALRYGYKRQKANSSPSLRISYLYDARDMTPAGMSYDAETHEGTWSWGDWRPFVEAICRPVMLKYDGTVDYELDHADQTKKLDGTASDIADPNYGGNAMVEFGSAFMWVKRWEDTDYEYCVFCNIQYDETYHAYAHVNYAGEQRNAFYLGMWEGPVVSGKLRSIGNNGDISNSINLETAITDAKANGTGYNIWDKAQWDYVADILTLISKTDDSQTAFGNGRQALDSDTSNRGRAGELVSTGAFAGHNDSTHPVKALWIVHPWGNLWQWMAGLVNDNGTLKCRMTPPYCDTPVSAANYSSYPSCGLPAPQTGGGFISETHMGDAFGLMWTLTQGSSTTYIPDRGNANNSQIALPIVGAYWYIAAGYAGARALYVNALASTSAGNIGSRLSQKPA